MGAALLRRQSCQKKEFVLTKAWFFGRQKGRNFHLESFGQGHQLGVGDTTELRFNFGDRVFTDVPTDAGTASREHGLCPLFPIPDFAYDRANNVLRLAHDFSLTVSKNRH